MSTPPETAPVTDEPTHYPPPAVGWAAVVVLFLLVVLSVLDRNILTLLVDPIKEDLGLNDVQMSLLYGLAFSLSYGMAAIPAGWAIDKFQRRIVIFFGVVIWSAATAFTGLARSFEALFAARSVVGAGEAVLSPGQQSMLTDLFPREKLALPLSVSALGLKVGGGAALIIGGMLAAIFPPSEIMHVPFLGDLAGWHIIFIVIGLPGALMAALIFLIPEPKRRLLKSAIPGKTPGFGEYFKLMRQHARFYFGHHLGQVAFISVMVGVSAWAPAFFARTHGWGETQIGLWLGSMMLWGSVIGLPIHAAIADKLFQRGVYDIHMRYSMFAALLAAPIGVAAFFMSDPIIACLMLGAFFMLTSVYASLPVVSIQAPLPSNMRGKAASIMLIVIGTGGTICGPLVIASLTELLFQDTAKLNQAIALTIGVGLPLVAALFAITLKPTRARMASTTPV
ncbi:MAG: MFS transporter [Terricaulis sp.]|nr:MFS transporter [Terricaulis sp.]